VPTHGREPALLTLTLNPSQEAGITDINPQSVSGRLGGSILTVMAL